MQRKMGGGGVIGASNDSDAEDGEPNLVLDSVQLKASPDFIWPYIITWHL
jgi:hypothetical protein